MTARLDLSPWAREAIPEAEREALRQRIPDGHALSVSTSNKRQYTCRLTSPKQGLVAMGFGPLDVALAKALA